MAVVKCTLCGGLYNAGRTAQHEAARWHKVAVLARRYRKMGLSYAEIGRQLRLSRYYISKKLHEEQL